MNQDPAVRSDALVLFGATGDLARKKIFPALLSMVRRGHLDVPIIGVATGGGSVDSLRARVRQGLEELEGGLDATAFDAYRQGVAANVSQSSARILDRFLNRLPTSRFGRATASRCISRMTWTCPRIASRGP